MIVYLSGPMTGYPEWNFPAFHAVAARLRGLGYTVLNPAETNDGNPDHPGGRPHYMRQDILHLLTAEGVALLDGWEHSKGALLEVAIARELALTIQPEGQYQ